MGEGVPAILHWHVAGASFPDCDFLENFDGENEMLLRRVTVSAEAVGVGSVVRCAEIGGGDGNRRAGDAPAAVEVGVLLAAAELEAGAADLAAVEEGFAECSGGHAVGKVTVAARAAKRVGGGVVRGMGEEPLGRWRGVGVRGRLGKWRGGR